MNKDNYNTDWTPPPRFKVGDTIRLSDGQDYLVILLNHTRARVRSLRRIKVNGNAYNPKTGQKDKFFSFLAPAKEMNIAPGTQPVAIKRLAASNPQ